MTLEATSMTPGGTLRCARHPNTETVLRCGRCETPICTKCQIQTPVGARCRTCAQVKRVALVLKPREMALAIGYGVGTATLGTIVYLYLSFLGPLISFAIVGFAVGETVAIGGNRKRAKEMGVIVVGALLVGFALGLMLFQAMQGVTPRIEVVFVALTNFMILIGLGVGALLGWMRAR